MKKKSSPKKPAAPKSGGAKDPNGTPRKKRVTQAPVPKSPKKY